MTSTKAVIRFFSLLREIKEIFRLGRIFFARDPGRITAPALVLFPVLRNALHCGLAGILAIKTKQQEDSCGDPKLALTLFPGIWRNDLTVLPEDKLTDHYLGGDSLLGKFQEAVYMLKENRYFHSLFFSPTLTGEFKSLSAELDLFIKKEEGSLEKGGLELPTAVMEVIARRLTLLKDVAWALKKDILEGIDQITALAGKLDPLELEPAALVKYRQMNLLLNSLDRLEVRGRDSAGLQVSFVLAKPEALEETEDLLKKKDLYTQYCKRREGGELVNLSLNLNQGIGEGGDNPKTSLTFTYKTSSIIGELGQNVRALRETIAQDRIFYEFARCDSCLEGSLVHTRWASVGAINEVNCHPVNNHALLSRKQKDVPVNYKYFPHYGWGRWSIDVVINGDIDNYQALRDRLAGEGISISAEVTTDTKIVPLVIEYYLNSGLSLAEAFRRALNEFEGSHAIAMRSNLEPHQAYLALKGSGQSLFVGLAQDYYIFSSEVYGLVEGTPRFIKMNGERRAAEGNGSQGQICILNQDAPGVSFFYYDGTTIPGEEKNVQLAEITTRDIDRGGYPHYFLKEITEAEASVHKTLRGKYVISGGEGGRSVKFNLGHDVIPSSLEEAFRLGRIKNIVVIGHGTAAVAGSAVAEALGRYLASTPIRVEAMVASELSGFSLSENMDHTLIIAITQSGTTTDTNRAVAMAVERGGFVVAIVNRRQSDITTKAQGVFYTSDGRDIEMSVASTKAFYSQIVAGQILALKIAQLLNAVPDEVIGRELVNLEQTPRLIREVIDRKEEIAQSVASLARLRHHWAVVGSGPNKHAAAEIRIKLSELCYKTIAADVVENKKHIDLSAEPLIIVCAAGNPEAVMGDVVKDVAIFKAHRAAVVVFADAGEERFNGIADSVIHLPRAEQPLPVILNTLAGHLWGYYAACSINEEAMLLRRFRGQLDHLMLQQERRGLSIEERLAERPFKQLIRDFAKQYRDQLDKGAFASARVKTIADLSLILKYLTGNTPLDEFVGDFNGQRDMNSPFEYLDWLLGQGIDELSRPIDAIRHQAKTVTVGTSRKEELYRGIIFNLLEELGFSVQTIPRKHLREILRVQKAIETIAGYTLYEIGNLDEEGKPVEGTTITILKKSGIAQGMRSRTESASTLMGTKRTIVSTDRIYIGYGRSDGAPLVIIPLRTDTAIKHLLLIHVVFNEALTLEERKALLDQRLPDLRNLINEYNFVWRDEYLQLVPLGCLLGEPVEMVAERIKAYVDKAV